MLCPRLSEFIKEDATTVFISKKIDGLIADGAGCIGINEAPRVACCAVTCQRLRRLVLFIVGIDRPKRPCCWRGTGASTVSVAAANAPSAGAPRVMIVSGQYSTKILTIIAVNCIDNAYFASPFPSYYQARTAYQGGRVWAAKLTNTRAVWIRTARALWALNFDLPPCAPGAVLGGLRPALPAHCGRPPAPPKPRRSFSKAAVHITTRHRATNGGRSVRLFDLHQTTKKFASVHSQRLR